MNEFRSVWFSDINTREQYEDIIRHVTILYLVYSAFKALSFFVTGSGLLIDGIIFALLALALRKWKSFEVSVLALVLTLVFLVLGILQLSGVVQLPRPNILLLVILAWASYRAVVGTYRFGRSE